MNKLSNKDDFKRIQKYFIEFKIMQKLREENDNDNQDQQITFNKSQFKTELEDILEKLKKEENRVIILKDLIINKAGKALIKSLTQIYKIDKEMKNELFWEVIDHPKIDLEAIKYVAKDCNFQTMHIFDSEIKKNAPNEIKLKNLFNIFQFNWSFFSNSSVFDNPTLDYKIFRTIFKNTSIPLYLNPKSNNPKAWEALMEIGTNFRTDYDLLNRTLSDKKHKLLILLLLSGEYEQNDVHSVKKKKNFIFFLFFLQKMILKNK